MSGYRTLHRERTSSPLWVVRFSPCAFPATTTIAKSNVIKHQSTLSLRPLRLVTAGADGGIRAYSLQASTESNELTASAIRLKESEVPLAPSSDDESLSMGSPSLDIFRSYSGQDDSAAAGKEVTAALSLDGVLTIWTRTSFETTATTLRCCSVENATGTTLKLLRSGDKDDTISVLVGCLDGSVALLATGISSSSPDDDETKTIQPTIGTVLETIGAGSSIPTSLTIHPKPVYSTIVVGRKDGLVDIYSSANKGRHYKRLHRLTFAAKTVRAVTYTPDGSLLLTGSDEGHVYLYDASTNDSYGLVGTIRHAHRSYILSMCALSDSTRFVTASADKTVKVWCVVGNSGAIHTFDTGHTDMIWSVSSSGTQNGSNHEERVASCGEDGMLQIYSCGK